MDTINNPSQLGFELESVLRNGKIGDELASNIISLAVAESKESVYDEISEEIHNLCKSYYDIKCEPVINQLDYLQNGITKLKTKYQYVFGEEEKSLSDEIHEALHQFNTGEDKSVRYKFKTAKQFQECTNDLNYGYYIIYADSNVGKSALMMSLAVEAMLENPGTSILWFSPDDSVGEVLDKMISCITFMYKPQEHTKINYVRQNSSSTILSKAWKHVHQMCETGKLDIRSVVTDINDIRHIITQARKNTDRLIVCYDSAYDISVPGIKSEEPRCQEIAVMFKDLSTKLKIPIITTNEAKKDKTDPDMKSWIKGGKWIFACKFAIYLQPVNPSEFADKKDCAVYGYVTKNKRSEHRKKIVYRFQTSCANYTELDEYDMIK